MSSATRIPTLFQVARLPSQAQAALEHLPHLVVQYQSAPGTSAACSWQRVYPQSQSPGRHFPPDVEVSPRLGLGVAHLVVGLQQQRRGQQAGRHAVPSIVRTVDLGEIVIAEQLAPQFALRPANRRRCPCPRSPDTTGPLPTGPSGPNAFPALPCSASLDIHDPEYNQSPNQPLFPEGA